MFTPKNFQENDPAVLLAFMRSHPFAVMLSAGGALLGTHLPFVTTQAATRITLTSHMALANPQAKHIAGERVLVVFSGPHAYISPSLYQNKVQVPTWNYVAVHAYGTVRLLDGHQTQMQVMEEMFQAFGPEYIPQWQTLPHQYRDSLLEHIVAFEIEVTDLQGQFKLSQNKPLAERERIMQSLAESPDAYARETADYMRKAGGQ